MWKPLPHKLLHYGTFLLDFFGGWICEKVFFFFRIFWILDKNLYDYYVDLYRLYFYIVFLQAKEKLFQIYGILRGSFSLYFILLGLFTYIKILNHIQRAQSKRETKTNENKNIKLI